jgi:glyoxylase-like metal-dependent hydrolase (beta-lactamase superfamily II)
MRSDPHDVPMPMDYYIWVARNQDRLVLVDTGFDQAMVVKRHCTLLRKPAGALRLIGVEAATVCDIVITHLHNDHAGDVLQGYRRLVARAESPAHAVPGHDPLVLERYPSVSPELAGIAARLDAPPVSSAGI